MKEISKAWAMILIGLFLILTPVILFTLGVIFQPSIKLDKPKAKLAVIQSRHEFGFHWEYRVKRIGSPITETYSSTHLYEEGDTIQIEK